MTRLAEHEAALEAIARVREALPADRMALGSWQAHDALDDLEEAVEELARAHAQQVEMSMALLQELDDLCPDCRALVEERVERRVA